ncbi:hypothetical protein Fmac_019547 [Flemingia macrophylla]|uniref:Uncharacterized protein n=1 Tax=Flemingia macrophylla TaxID=520843 RepID=A0ABD1M8B2_9FABA
MFGKHHHVSLKDAANSTDLLGLNPFNKVVVGPVSPERYSLQVPSVHAKSDHPSQNGHENDIEDSISEIDVENIVGVGSSSELEEMDPPSNLLCELRSYQKQALYWMIQMEKGQSMDETTTLHPCWEAYHLADKDNAEDNAGLFSIR